MASLFCSTHAVRRRFTFLGQFCGKASISFSLKLLAMLLLSMPQFLKCGAELPVNEEGIAPVLCDSCAGRATSRARRGLSTGTMRDYPATTALTAINLAVFVGMLATGGGLMGFT